MTDRPTALPASWSVLVCSLLLTLWVVDGLAPPVPVSAAAGPALSPTERRQAVAAASREAAGAIARRCLILQEELTAGAAGAPDFGEAVTSWYGKWRAVKPYLPFADDDGHTHFIREAFAEHLLSDEAIAACLRRSISGAIQDVRAAQDRLAIRLAAGVTAAQPEAGGVTGDEAVRERFAAAVMAVAADTHRQVLVVTGEALAAELVSEVAVQVFIRLGVSAGLIGAGAANAWWSLGISVVVMVIVEAVWSLIDDTAERIAAAVQADIVALAARCAGAVRQELLQRLEATEASWGEAAGLVGP